MRLRHASGIREKDLAERARTLRDSVAPLLPKLSESCPPERFDRLRRDLEEVRENRDDERRLERMSRWGEPLVRAYAGLLRFHLAPEMPSLLTLTLPEGEISFAPLGRATPEAEIAVQHFENPHRLLLGYLDWARKGFHFFAGPTQLWCTGKDPTPPPEFVADRVASLPYRLLEDPTSGIGRCSHLAAGEARPYLEVAWPAAGRTFRVCRRCARDDRHLGEAIRAGTAGPDPEGEFPIAIRANVDCRGGEECVHAGLPEASRGLRREYDRGRLKDGPAIAAYLEEIRPRLEGTRRPTYVAGGVCFGADRAAFLEALRPSEVERRALEAALAEQEGLFSVDEPSASRALERLWADHAEAIVRSIVRDPEEARRYFTEGRRTPGRVAELLKRAQRRSEERETLGALPRYARLNREAAYVDAVARAYRVQGPTGAERAAIHALPPEGRERGLAFGLLLALGRAASHTWQFSDSEREFGRSLEPAARELFRVPAERYHEALDRLLHDAGVPDWGQRAPD
ncbi:MAG: hypothetical protein QXG65_01080 [Thermoplasmata archaeon]